MKYCPNCGTELQEGAEVCLKCGKLINGKTVKQQTGQKSKLAAGLLGIFLGGWGIHSFYLGNPANCCYNYYLWYWGTLGIHRRNFNFSW